MPLFENKVLLITGGTGSFGHAVLDRFLTTDIREIRILSRAEKKQDVDGRSPLEMKLPMPFEALKKQILRKIDKTVIGKLLRDHGVLKDWMV